MGGFGVPDPEFIHHVSFLACEAAVSESITSLQLERNLPPFEPSPDARMCYESQCIDKDLFPSLEVLYEEPYKLQHRLSLELYKRRRAELCSIGPSVAQRLDSCSEEGAILVTCIPKETNMTVPNDVMRERLCMRAGLPIPSITCGPCNCGSPEGFVDEMNFHLLSGCKKDGCRIANHNAIRDTLIEFCRQANLTCRPECRVVCQADDPETRKKVDLSIDNFNGTIPLGVDVSVVDPRCSKYTNLRKSMAAGKAAKDREDHKIKKYRDTYVNQSCEFEPFVLESFGRFGNRTRELFNELVDRVHASKDQFTSSYLKQYWSSRIVMALHISAARGVKQRMDDVRLGRRGIVNEVAAVAACDEVDHGHFSRCRF
jgi:hypothetical protein